MISRAVRILLPVVTLLAISCSDSSGPGDVLSQFASSATASSSYSETDWSASRAVGEPNVVGCDDHPNAWAAQGNFGEDWLEVSFTTPVAPTRIDIYEVWTPGSIARVEVKNAAGSYVTVYQTTPGVLGTCPRVLSFGVTSITEKISVVRIHVDHRILLDWDEIDAVKLTGRR